jgi:hypothetical protein
MVMRSRPVLDLCGSPCPSELANIELVGVELVGGGVELTGVELGWVSLLVVAVD